MPGFILRKVKYDNNNNRNNTANKTNQTKQNKRNNKRKILQAKLKIGTLFLNISNA